MENTDLLKPEPVGNLEGLETQNFIDALRLMQPLSPGVLSGNAQPGDFVLANEVNLGDNFVCIPVAQQWHAMQLEGRKIVAQSYDCVQALVQDPFNKGKEILQVIPYTENNQIIEDHPQTIFHRIVNGVDDNKKGLAHLWGKDMLFYLPDIGRWGQFFFSKKTTRKRFKEFNAFLGAGKIVVCRSHHVSPPGTTYQWWEPRADNYEGDTNQFIKPSKESIEAAVEKFKPKPDATPIGEEIEEGDR